MAVVCPTQAISFPSRHVVWKAEREHKIFKAVHGEAKERRDRSAALIARQRAEEQIGTTTTRVQVRIAGVFGEKRFLAQLEELIRERPYDIENLQLSVPTLKGLLVDTPAHMNFELASRRSLASIARKGTLSRCGSCARLVRLDLVLVNHLETRRLSFTIRPTLRRDYCARLGRAASRILGAWSSTKGIS